MKNFFKELMNIVTWLFLILFFFNVLGSNYFYDKLGLYRLFQFEYFDYFREEKSKEKVILLNDYFYSFMIYQSCQEEETTKLITVYKCSKEQHEK